VAYRNETRAMLALIETLEARLAEERSQIAVDRGGAARGSELDRLEAAWSLERRGTLGPRGGDRGADRSTRHALGARSPEARASRPAAVVLAGLAFGAMYAR
jgi:hypothetical protein